MFNIDKYLGKWYELLHYPSWFQQNDQYNTTAEYYLENDRIRIINTTVDQGKPISSEGFATQLHDNHFRVNFLSTEVDKLLNTINGDLSHNDIHIDENYANYVIDHIWVNYDGDYIFAVVTDQDYNSLYVLSRYKHPSLYAYNEVIDYVVEHYDKNKLVATPHYSN